MDRVKQFFGLDGSDISSEDWKRLFRTGKRNLLKSAPLGFTVETFWEGRGAKVEFTKKGTPLVYQTRAYVAGTRVEAGRWSWTDRIEAANGHKAIVEALESGKYGPDATDLQKVMP